MVEDKKDKIISLYEDYIFLIDLLLSDINSVSLEDLHDLITKLQEEVEKIKHENKTS